MSKSIFPSKTAIETVRDNGYNDTASAISELIDNSIDAKSKNIQILVFEKTITKGNRPMKEISEIVIVDDGKGMNVKEMETSLQFGNGTKSNNTDDEIIGKFGIGLPNASVSQCKRVEVYSWQKNKDLYTYLDVDEIISNDQEKINDIIEKKLPDNIKKEITSYESGTAIIWSKCDNLDIARGETLYRRMSKKLCRVFRHYLDHKNSTPGNIMSTEDQIFNFGLQPLFRNQENINLVKDAMFAATNEVGGTSYRSRHKNKKFMFAGKTGSSQIKRFTEEQREAEVKQENISYLERDHAWFVAFAPVSNPRYAISVLVEHGGSGSSAAAPLAKNIIKKVLERHQGRSSYSNRKMENI